MELRLQFVAVAVVAVVVVVVASARLQNWRDARARAVVPGWS